MSNTLSYHFLIDAHRSLAEVNRAIGRIDPASEEGELQPEASDQDARLLEAIVGLTRTLEYLQQWAVELSVRLEDAGIVENLRSAP